MVPSKWNAQLFHYRNTSGMCSCSENKDFNEKDHHLKTSFSVSLRLDSLRRGTGCFVCDSCYLSQLEEELKYSKTFRGWKNSFWSYSNIESIPVYKYDDSWMLSDKLSQLVISWLFCDLCWDLHLDILPTRSAYISGLSFFLPSTVQMCN